MKIIFYNPNSRGGNFDYVLELLKAYQQHPDVSSVQILLPTNAELPDNISSYYKLLMTDKPRTNVRLLSQLFFLIRTFVNPMRLYFHLYSCQSAYVIFNDYDQASSFYWIPLLKFLKKKFVFAVILHDPDRDHYFRFRWLSTWTMKKVMSLMDVAFFHDLLPIRSYYTSTKCQYVSVPHGYYDELLCTKLNDALLQHLLSFKANELLIGAIGNIRVEKNYDLLIEVIGAMRGLKLLIFGVPANTSVKVEKLNEKVRNFNATGRVIIIEKYANTEELKAIGEACDAFIMYYSNSFKSQSGVLNLFSPFRKPFLVSDNGSPMTALVGKFELGLSAFPDSKEALSEMLKKFHSGIRPSAKWDDYFMHASWRNHAEIAINILKKIKKTT